MTTVVALPSLMLALLLANAQASAADGSEKPPVPGSATLLTLDGGVAVQLLEISRRPTKDAPTGRLNVGYWVGPDAGSLSTETGREVEVLRANEVFTAFRAWALATGVQEVVLSAAAGRPGDAGRILDLYWTRGASGDWEKGTPKIREMLLPVFPALAVPVVRDSEQETVIAFLGLMNGTLLDSGQYGQALKLIGSDAATSTQADDLGRAVRALEAMHGKVKDRKPLAWVYSVTDGRMATDSKPMVRFATTSDSGQGTEDVTFAAKHGDDWKVVGYQRFAQVRAGGGDRSAVVESSLRTTADRPGDDSTSPTAVPPPAESKTADDITVRLYGRWKVVGHKRVRGSEGVDDPNSWKDADIVFGKDYFGDKTCRCEGPVASATEMSVAAFFDTEYRDSKAVDGMTPAEIVTVVTVECHGGRHLPWKGELDGACVATTPFETILLLKSGEAMVFGASWAYRLKKK